MGMWNFKLFINSICFIIHFQYTFSEYHQVIILIKCKSKVDAHGAIGFEISKWNKIELRGIDRIQFAYILILLKLKNAFFPIYINFSSGSLQNTKGPEPFTIFPKRYLVHFSFFIQHTYIAPGYSHPYPILPGAGNGKNIAAPQLRIF